MKTPCYNCPFRINSPITLSQEKVLDIFYGITHDAGFDCHQTIDYSTETPTVTPDSNLCFGSVLFLENIAAGGCRSNIAYRFALMRGEFKVTDLRTDNSIYQTPDDFIQNSF